ncbi:MAG: hypothetical protein HPY76_13085, partial [Anaerolineae bacterium]|nr:hypothetical protein [Anaerolineae bacterium]
MIETLLALPAFRSLLDEIRSGDQIPGLGLPRAVRLPLLAALSRSLDIPVLFLTDRMSHALSQVDELDFWLPQDDRKVLFPEPNPLFYEQAAWGSVTRKDRITVLSSLISYHLPGVQKPSHPPLIIAPIRAVMTRTMPRRDFFRSSRIIKVGMKCTLESLIHEWVGSGYQPVDMVVEPGSFSRRGGLLDIWPPAEPYPVRLDFFGDELDTLRQFDPATQRTVARLESIFITPARELLLSK